MSLVLFAGTQLPTEYIETLKQIYNDAGVETRFVERVET